MTSRVRGSAGADANAPQRQVHAARREFVIALIAAVVGAGLLFLAGSRGWVTLSVSRGRPLPDLRRTVSGSKAIPLIYALAVLGLAGVVALLATRQLGRRIVGLLLALVAVLGLIWLARDLGGISASRAESLLSDAGPVVGVPAHAHINADVHTLPAVLAVLGALLLALVGLAAAVRGGGWPAMGSRYDRPRQTPDRTARGVEREDAGDSVAARDDDVSGGAERATRPSAGADRRLWEALDRGEDPTAGEDSRPESG